MLRQVGLAIGVAILVAVIGTRTSAHPLATFQAGWYVIAAFAALGAPISLLLRPRAARAAALGAEPAP